MRSAGVKRKAISLAAAMIAIVALAANCGDTGEKQGACYWVATEVVDETAIPPIIDEVNHCYNGHHKSTCLAKCDEGGATCEQQKCAQCVFIEEQCCQRCCVGEKIWKIFNR